MCVGTHQRWCWVSSSIVLPLFLTTTAVLKLKPSHRLEQWARPSGSPSPPPVQRLQRVLPCPALSGCWASKTRSSCLGIKSLLKETSHLALYLGCHVCDQFCPLGFYVRASQFALYTWLYIVLPLYITTLYDSTANSSESNRSDKEIILACFLTQASRN